MLLEDDRPEKLPLLSGRYLALYAAFKIYNLIKSDTKSKIQIRARKKNGESQPDLRRPHCRDEGQSVITGNGFEVISRGEGGGIGS